jgi:hypothetical protein
MGCLFVLILLSFAFMVPWVSLMQKLYGPPAFALSLLLAVPSAVVFSRTRLRLIGYQYGDWVEVRWRGGPLYKGPGPTFLAIPHLELGRLLAIWIPVMLAVALGLAARRRAQARMATASRPA